MSPLRTSRAITLVMVVTSTILVGCGSSNEATPPTTSIPASTSTTSTSTTTTSTTTTVYVGPPTLAPGESLPQPESLPDEDTVEPEVVVGAIHIPRIELLQTIYRGVTLPTLDKGIGWWPGTAMPGQVGNVVLGGHRVSKKKPFRHLDKLQVGDEIFMSSEDGDFVYTVRETFIVQPSDVWIIDQTEAATLTLFACHPPGSTRERIVVVA
ncbi:MAG: sortase, partial [Ilumatobacteraceae bacterium]